MADLDRNARTTPRRLADRARYDLDTIRAILDEALVCHLAVLREGRPLVLPTLHVRIEDRLYVHGSAASPFLRDARNAEVCAAVTLLDGLVLARSAFHHSVNYRSVVVFGTASEVTDDARKREVLMALVDHVVAGRSSDCRAPSPAELRATMVLSIPLREGSAKVRHGPVVDDAADLALPHWAGVVPIRLQAGPPQPDAGLPADVPTPAYLRDSGRKAQATPPFPPSEEA